MSPRAALTLLALAATAAPALAAGEGYPEFPGLAGGRQVWLANCAFCHTSSLSDAPLVSDRAAWAPRLKQDRATLHGHALNGHTGPKGTEMPPRGGNPKLADAEVKSAVDYMIELVTH